MSQKALGELAWTVAEGRRLLLRAWEMPMSEVVLVSRVVAESHLALKRRRTGVPAEALEIEDPDARAEWLVEHLAPTWQGDRSALRAALT